MKTISKYIIVLAGILASASCSFLDVVPNDSPTLDHAFANRQVAYRFLSTCYSSLPDPTDPFCYPAYLTSQDEYDMGYGANNRHLQMMAGQIMIGSQNSNNPYQNYWDGYTDNTNRINVPSLYVGIRDCNIFLENIDKPKDIEESERIRWIAEAKFLKAYFHLFLIQLYGPIVIVDKNLPVSVSPEESMLFRSPVDECIDYVVNLLDEAIADLPDMLEDVNSEFGRITKPIAISVKAKALAWAASPLFNGNSDYSSWVGNCGKQMISSTYDKSKWERAAKAIKEAIDCCEANGAELYVFDKYKTSQCFNMNEQIEQIMTIRKAITTDQETNHGVIWSSQEHFGNGKGGCYTVYSLLSDLPRMCVPMTFPQDAGATLGYFQASWWMTDLFYSKNGVPIDEDTEYDYANRFKLRMNNAEDGHGSYMTVGRKFPQINFDREPRFYADLGFLGGFYESTTNTQDAGATFSPAIYCTDPSLVMTYYAKKIVPYEASCSRGSTNYQWTAYDYRFPLLRLADLYLLYAEALNEVKDSPDSEVYEYIDKVRKVAGLKGVAESWANHSNNPDKVKNQEGMREIIRRERLIELAFEGQRFWDVRRWKEFGQYWSLTPTRFISAGEDEYTTEQTYEKREVSFKDGLWPLKNYTLRVNRNLEQNYGWD